jgi:cytochrome b561
LSHRLLYLIMLGMPLSGYLFSAWGRHAVTYFGLFTLPGLAKNDTLQQVAFWAHVAIGQWLTYALILLHIGATGWHVAVRRDGVLFRIVLTHAAGLRCSWGRNPCRVGAGAHQSSLSFPHRDEGSRFPH